MIAEGFTEDEAVTFVEQVKGCFAWDFHRVNTVKDKLRLTDAELCDLARTVLRVYGELPT